MQHVRYTKQRAETQHADIAVYRLGEPQDALEVARMSESDAEVIEVWEWGVLVVRYWGSSDFGPPKRHYVVVHDGQALVYDHQYDSLYVTDLATLERDGWKP